MLGRQSGQSHITVCLPFHPDSKPDSLLLKLPNELRNLIYEYTFGTNWLHISEDGKTARLCLEPSRYFLRRDVIKSSPTRQRFVPAYAHHHGFHLNREKCPKRKKLPLELLMVCRQVYHEARLLPFSMNIFVFERRSILANFLKAQSEERSLTMRSLLLECPLDVDHESHRLLAKMERVMVFALLFDRSEYWSGRHSHTATFTSLREHMACLSSANVCLEFCGSTRTSDWDFRRAEADIEDYLTGGACLSDRTRKLLG
jgi:hypothetical protein